MNRTQIHNAYVGTFTLVLSFGMVFLYLSALKYHLFYTHRWIDIPMHFLGGLVIASLSYFISNAATANDDKAFPTNALVISILLSVFLVGIIWEVYEVIFKLNEELHYWRDTIADMVMDMLGAGVVAYYASWRSNRVRKALDI
jgi:Na+/H+-dicarboxylate symporter